MRRRSAHLPNALVGLAPPVGRAVGQVRQHTGQLRFQASACARQVDMRRIEQVAVDVELTLSGRAVAHAHGPRAAVPLQVTQLGLGHVGAAVDAVHDLQAAAGSPTLGQPAEETVGCEVVPHRHQGMQHQRRIAQPAKPIVPIALAAQALGQGAGRRRDDGTRRAEGQQLQDESARLHFAPIRALVAEGAGPVGPTAQRVLQQRRRLRHQCVRRAVAAGQGRPGLAARFDGPTAAQNVAARLRRQARRCAHVHRLLAAVRLPACGRAAPACRPAPEIETRLACQLELDPAVQPFDAAQHRTARQAVEVGIVGVQRGRRHEVGQPHTARRRFVFGDEHRALAVVAALDGARMQRADAKEAARAGVEQAAKNGGAVEMRQATPVDGPVARHQGGAQGVADQRVVGDRQVISRSPVVPRHANRPVVVERRARHPC